MKYFLASLAILIPLGSQAEEIELPRSVELVLSKRIDQSKLRVIGHNMHITNEIEIQRLKIPGLALQERRIIKYVKVDDRIFDFIECASVSYNAITFQENQVQFELEFIPLRDPNIWILNCQVDVSGNQIGEPKCTKTLFEWPEEIYQENSDASVEQL